MEVDKISASQLKQTLETDSNSILILDCRPFLAFNSERIVGASNVYCPAILRRRFVRKGFLNLDTILSQDIRKRLKTGQYTRVVLYETVDMDTHVERSGTSEIAIIIQGLQRNNYSLKNASILKGGFKKFKHEYPQLCTGSRLSCDIGIPKVSPSGNPQYFYERQPTELLPHLFIGDEQNSCNKEILDKIGITAILNVSSSCQSLFTSNYTYKVIPVQDKNNENILVWFAEAIQFIENVERNQGKVLVHCKAGVSRSATVCIAYLMCCKTMTFEQAFEFVRARRNIISPNISFMQQLIEFESVLTVKRSNSKVLPGSSEGETLDKQSLFSFGFFGKSTCALTSSINTGATPTYLNTPRIDLSQLRL